MLPTVLPRAETRRGGLSDSSLGMFWLGEDGGERRRWGPISYLSYLTYFYAMSPSNFSSFFYLEEYSHSQCQIFNPHFSDLTQQL